MRIGETGKLNRRVFVKSLGGAAGGLMVGVTYGCSEPDRVEDALENSDKTANAESIETLNAYVRIGTDNIITVINPSADMGQGVDAALPQIVADELDASWDQVRVERAPYDKTYANPAMFRPMQTTAASTSVRYYFEPLRQAGAAAREMLKQAAVSRWGVEISDCATADGFVVRLSDGERFSYGELATEAALLDPPQDVPLKSAGDYIYIGKSLGRPEQADKTDGQLVYTIDVNLPDMAVAALALAPQVGGTLRGVDDSAIADVPGVRQVVEMDDAVAVVADKYWQAKKALDLLSIEWAPGESAGLTTAALYSTLQDGATNEDGVTFMEEGDLEAAFADADKNIQGTYIFPYLAHMPMEPLSCVAQITEDGCEVWSGTQNITRSTDIVAEYLGISVESVRVHTLPMGGSFGRRLGYDLEVRTVEVAQAVGVPVKVIWPREQDVRHDYYRPAVAIHMRAALTEEGEPAALELKVAMQASPLINDKGLDPAAMSAIDEASYEIPTYRYAYVRRDSPIPIGTWRSVTRSYNTFAYESAVDEMAYAAGRDPYRFRRDLIKDNPRLLGVLDLAAQKAGWGETLPQGRARGIACWSCYGSHVAQVVEVSLDQGDLRIHRVVNAVDCGLVINPNGVRQQIEGGMIQGLTAILMNEITLEDGAVVESNFHDYPFMDLAATPAVEVHIVESTEAPGGIGEVGTPAAQAALTNAIFALTGKRIRQLPVSRHDLTAA